MCYANDASEAYHTICYYLNKLLPRSLKKKLKQQAPLSTITDLSLHVFVAQKLNKLLGTVSILKRLNSLLGGKSSVKK